MQDRLDALQAIYDAERAAAVEIDPLVVPRVLIPEVLESELFLVGQALGRDTQRLSGLPYVFPDWPPYRLSNGGHLLDRWLDDCGYTINHGERSRRYAFRRHCG